jgi:glycosyltransferase involved in cell wall biosynthesis
VIGGRPLVSVIISTYSRAEQWPGALESARAQEGAGTDFDMEIIVIDDASTDATPTVLREYPEVRCLRLPSDRGGSAAKNAGINASRGEYIAFLDDDDYRLPHKLRRQVPVLEAHPEAHVAYSPYVIRLPDQSEAVYPDADAPSGSVLDALIMGNCCGAPLGVARRRRSGLVPATQKRGRRNARRPGRVEEAGGGGVVRGGVRPRNGAPIQGGRICGCAWRPGRPRLRVQKGRSDARTLVSPCRAHLGRKRDCE